MSGGIFLGRENEVKYLQGFYDRPGSQILVVYGTKGVGKTALLKHFSEDKESVYYAARLCSDREQLQEWRMELLSDGNTAASAVDYAGVLEGLCDEAPEKKIIIIDEFQNLIGGEGEFFKALTEYVANRGDEAPVLVVLLSSASGYIENNLVHNIGALARNISGFLKLKELPLQMINTVFKDFSIKDAFCYYAVLGGIPGLWKSLDTDKDFKENITDNIISPYSKIYRDMEVFMAENLREPAVYNTILKAISSGKTKLNDIYAHTGYSRAKISVYLKNLMELDVIEKLYAGVYEITIPYLRFYFKFIFPNRSDFERLSTDEFFDKRVAPELLTFSESAYRESCRQKASKELPSGNEASEILDKRGNVDIMYMTEDGVRVVGMCVLSRMLTEKDYRAVLKNAKRNDINADKVILYSEVGFDNGLEKYVKKGILELKSLFAG